MEQAAIIKKLLDNEAALCACAMTLQQLSKNNREMREMLEGKEAAGPTALDISAEAAGQRFLKNLHRKAAKRVGTAPVSNIPK